MLCRECDKEIYVSEKTLENHVTKCHIDFRNKNNLDIVHDLVYDADCGPSFWTDGLAFLASLQLDPPPF